MNRCRLVVAATWTLATLFTACTTQDRLSCGPDTLPPPAVEPASTSRVVVSSIDYGLVVASASGQFRSAFGVSNEGPTSWTVSNERGTVVGTSCGGSGVFLLETAEASADLVADRPDVSEAVISGDGQTIAIAERKAQRILAINVRTNETQEIASGEAVASASDLALSYDGLRIAWQNGFALMEASTQGDRVTQIAGSQGGGPGEEVAHDAAYSADGRMAYVTGKDSETTIMLSDLHGGDATQIPLAQGTADMLAWSPQSNRLAFYSRQERRDSGLETRVSLIILDVATGTISTVIGPDAGLNPIMRPQWSSDEPDRLLVELDDPSRGTATITSLTVQTPEITPLFSLPYVIGAFPSWVPRT